ncbi:MAG: B12-binding domain-containing radical SAM protein, partial [Caldiserica bacterium]
MFNEKELLSLRKPARYIGEEWNEVKKDWDNKIRVVLSYPDFYEVGMSNLGLSILYHLINERKDSLCERVFLPDIDLEKLLIKKDIPLFSLESKKPVKDFHIFGVSIQTELTYTNFLNLLYLSKIPVFSRDRKDFPVVIVGGPSALNPMPLLPFVDAFVIGEGEEVVGEIIDEFVLDREDFLKRISNIKGVFVPKFGIKKVVKRYVKDLDKTYFPVKPIVPYTEVIHERAVVEIFRGCDRGCRFCISGMEKRPRRERSVKNILSLIQEILKNTGFEEVSLLSLSTSDYSNLLPLVEGLREITNEKKISVSLPSLRIDNFSLEVLDLIDTGRKTTLTFAPEAGTERLRDVINKPIKDDDIFSVVREAVKRGWRKIKFYFMIGLPTETMEDIEGIVDIVRRIRMENKRITLHLSINPFIPKPFTPFQWEKFIPKEDYLEKRSFLKRNIKGARLSFRRWEESFIEAILSRGNKELADVIYDVWKRGGKYETWSEKFDFSLWEESL